MMQDEDVGMLTPAWWTRRSLTSLNTPFAHPSIHLAQEYIHGMVKPVCILRAIKRNGP